MSATVDAPVPATTPAPGGARRICQVCYMPDMSEPMGAAALEGIPLRGRAKILLKRWFSPSFKRRVKARTNRLIRRFPALTSRGEAVSLSSASAAAPAAHLAAGDLVRVRPREEILATLDAWKELKGCYFMPEMWAYAGTTQRVLKPVERIVDERDYRVRKCRGVVLLEGAICPGTELFGKCDRSCFFFWREEWLEKIEAA